MGPRHSETPCFVSPHPDILAKLKANAFKVQGGDGSLSAMKKMAALLNDSQRFPGMDDGLIFPKEHYDKPVSIMAMSQAAAERAPLRGNIRVIVCLSEFKDVKLAAGAKQRIQDVFFSTGKLPGGSVTEYYKKVSNNKVTFTGEVIGPFTLKQTMAYYANNYYGRTSAEPNSRTMANETFEAARNSVDWKPYDNDGNGYVDAFIVVHAGEAADTVQSPENIWSVKWVLPEEKKQSGVSIYGFLTVSEFAKIGVCAHELGHLVFGWPDLYDTDDSSAGIGSWCLMSGGSWGGGGDRPVHPSAWCKMSQNWVETITETTNHRITLPDIKTSFKTHRLWTNGNSNSQEYFLLENRQPSDPYDASLPGAGLLVWHIDDAIPSNTDENHPKVKLLEADGLNELKSRYHWGDAGDPFPGLSGNVRFDAVSNPSSKAYNGQDTFVSVTNVPASGASMTFDITVKPISQVPASAFDAKKWYRIKNTYEPGAYSLDVVNDGGANSKGLVQMARDGNFSGQMWQIRSNDDGTFFLRSLFLGAERRLDVYGDDKFTAVLKPAQWVSGQYWVVKGWGDGTWHLENAFSGPNLYLDTIEGGPKVKLNASNAGRPTQRWTITPVRDITETEFF